MPRGRTRRPRPMTGTRRMMMPRGRDRTSRMMRTRRPSPAFPGMSSQDAARHQTHSNRNHISTHRHTSCPFNFSKSKLPRGLVALLRRNRHVLRRRGVPRRHGRDLRKGRLFRRRMLADNRFARNAMRANVRMRRMMRWRRQNKTTTITIQAALAVQVKKPAAHATVAATSAANTGPMRQRHWPRSLDLISVRCHGSKKSNAQQLLHLKSLSHLLIHLDIARIVSYGVRPFKGGGKNYHSRADCPRKIHVVGTSRRRSSRFTARRRHRPFQRRGRPSGCSRACTSDASRSRSSRR